MMKINLEAQSITIDKQCILATTRIPNNTNKLNLIRIKLPKLKIEKLHVFNGTRSLLLVKLQDLYMVSIDEKLLISTDLVEWREVLKVRPGNIIWHASETSEGIIMQEYGEPPTHLWFSANGFNWRKLLSNLNVDPTSKHFHYIAYDNYRNVCYATLGDGNIIRAIVIKESSWESLYKGPWQFVPVEILKDKLVFGFDSGIAHGGIGIYTFDENKWKFLFIKWATSDVKHVQMNKLKYFNGYWVCALGAPQAVLISRDLKFWYPLVIEGLEQRFNHHVSLYVIRDFIIASTGRRIVIAKKENIDNAFIHKPMLIPYGAYTARIKGILFNIKRKIMNSIISK